MVCNRFKNSWNFTGNKYICYITNIGNKVVNKPNIKDIVEFVIEQFTFITNSLNSRISF